MSSLLAKNRLYRMLNSLTINVTDIGSLFNRTSRDILPYPNELGIGQRTTVSIRNDKIRLRICFCFTETFSQAIRNWDFSSCRLSLQFIQNNRFIMLRMPCSSY